MRPSKREQILDAALAVVESEGSAAATFDAVAAASGVSRGGLLYHFPSKEALLLGLHEHQAQLWERELVATLGRQPEEASDGERLAAYARTSARSATGAELLLMLEASKEPALDRPWREVIRRWVPDASGVDPADPRALERIAAYLAADGLWLSGSLASVELAPELRVALAEHIARSVEGL